MIDIKLLREDFERLRESVAKKKFTVDWDAIQKLDDERRACIAEAESARSQQKAVKLDKKAPDFQDRLKEMKVLSSKVKELESKAKEVEAAWKEQVLSIPNMPHESVPVGKSEDENEIASTWGDLDGISAHAIPHFDIPWFSEVVDFERGVKVTGAGFPFYVGDMARLVRALINFFLDEASKKGYQEVLAPLLVNPASATATGQLPDKEGQMYHATNDDLYLIPTAEVPVTNFFREEIFEESDLPIYRCGYTPCFRREAGSWGAHVRGLNRLHQFDKVEVVKWVHPDHSFDELDKLRQDSEDLLQKLELPYRVLLMCTGDIGFPHAKQYDLEVWAGGQKRWLEVSSCSNFTDFQARRAMIRYRPTEGGKPEAVHTLNGSALALPRTIAAILENNYQEDGTVKIPKVLQPWYGKEVLAKPS